VADDLDVSLKVVCDPDVDAGPHGGDGEPTGPHGGDGEPAGPVPRPLCRDAKRNRIVL